MEETFRRLVELVPDAMIIVDDTGRIVLVNEQTGRLFGYATDELIGRNVEILVPDRVRDRHVGHRGEYSADPHTRAMGAELELHGRRKDGTEFPVEIALSPLDTDGGRLVCSTIRDITDRKRSEDRFRRLLESAPDAMVIVDSHGTIVLVNAQAERLFMYRRAEMIGHNVELLVPDRFHDRHAGHRQNYGDDPHTRAMGAELELFGKRKDGSEFPVEISLSPLESDDETLISSAIRDISDRKRAEQLASHFRAVVESSHDAIIGKNLDGLITSWNTGAERLFGYTEAEIRGKPASILTPPGQDDDQLDLLLRVRAGERVDDHETVRARKDGMQVDVSITMSPIRDSAGAVVGVSSIARDITARLRHQQQLRFLAEHDPLTGARNRRRFERDVSDQVGRARRYGEQAALLMIDIDGLKQINDSHGHRTGDRAIRDIAGALRHRLRETDIIARVGGDEFAVLLPYADGAQATAVVQDLDRVIRATTIELDDGTRLPLSASIGFSLIDRETENDDVVLARADRSMYERKRSRSSGA